MADRDRARGGLYRARERPGCGESSEVKLPGFSAPEFPHLRLQACDTCGAYLPLVDLARDPLAIPEVDELAGLPLDLWAAEQGYRKLQPNLAEDFFRSHGVGDILTGRVVRLTEFGAFLELYEGIEGLVHVSEMSKERVEKPEDAVQVDAHVRVKIIKMDAVEKKIGLSIKAALDEPEEASLNDYVHRQEGDGIADG